MTIQTLEEFDQEQTKKRARLVADLALVATLPTHGVTVNWTGEGGFEEYGNTRKTDVARSIALQPFLIHQGIHGARWVSFRFPDSLSSGEHVSSAHRGEFVRRYLSALLDACEQIIDTVAIRGTYASYVPATFDYTSDSDHKDAKEAHRGRYVIIAETGDRYSAAELQWYIDTAKTGPVRIDIDLNGFPTYKLSPNISMDNFGRVKSVNFPTTDKVGAAALIKRSSDGHHRAEWLFGSREAMETALGLR